MAKCFVALCRPEKLKELATGDESVSPLASTASSRSRLVVEVSKTLAASSKRLVKLQSSANDICAREEHQENCNQKTAAFASWLQSPEKRTLEAAQALLGNRRQPKRKASGAGPVKKKLNFNSPT